MPRIPYKSLTQSDELSEKLEMSTAEIDYLFERQTVWRRKAFLQCMIFLTVLERIY